MFGLRAAPRCRGQAGQVLRPCGITVLVDRDQPGVEPVHHPRCTEQSERLGDTCATLARRLQLDLLLGAVGEECSRRRPLEVATPSSSNESSYGWTLAAIDRAHAVSGRRLSSSEREASWVATSGSRTVKVLPTPSSLWTVMVPPIRSVSCLQIASPSPVPS